MAVKAVPDYLSRLVAEHHDLETQDGDPYMPYASAHGRRQVITLALRLFDEILPLAGDAGCMLLFEGIFDLRCL